MFEVVVGVKIEDSVKLLRYQASTIDVSTAITHLFSKENWCTCTSIIDKDNQEKTIIFKSNKDRIRPIDNIARLFLLDYWVDGENDKVWKILK